MQIIGVNSFCRSYQLLSIAVVCFLLSGCGYQSESGGENENESNIPAVEAVKARYGSLPLSERLSGTVRADNQVTLSPEISGPVERVYVQDGDKVQQGDPLVKLKDDRFREQFQQAKAGANISQAQLKQAQSQLRQLQGQFERIKKLREKDMSSEQEFENIQSQVESAQADVDLAQAELEQARATMQEQQNMLDNTVIRAPIAGTVGQRNAETGMQVTPSTQLFVIGNLDNVIVEVVLTEDMMTFIEVGQDALVYTNNNSEDRQTVKATVARISPFLNNVTRSTEAEIEVENQEQMLNPGMFVPVDILYGDSRQATIIPTSALYTDPQTGEEGVYVASSIGLEIEPADSVNPDNPPPLTEPTPVEFKQIDVVARGRMEVGISGIDSGSWVVTVGQDLLSEGRTQARVRTVKWDRIFTMQQMQRQDLLQKVLDSQSRSARSPS